MRKKFAVMYGVAAGLVMLFSVAVTPASATTINQGYANLEARAYQKNLCNYSRYPCVVPYYIFPNCYGISAGWFICAGGELVAKIKGVNEVCFVNSAWRSDGSQAAGTEDCL